MEELYGWIRNLTGYFLFMSVLDNLLPGKKYTRYIRLFSGMVLILLVLQPLTVSLRLEERIAHYYESFVFQYQADDLKQELLGVEKQQLEQLIGQYEHAVEQDVEQMAEDAGFTVQSCLAQIGREEGTESFGTVTGIQVTLGECAESTEYGVDPVRPVEQVQVRAWTEARTPEEEQKSVQSSAQSDAELRAKAGTLRRKIASYYNLEESYVEVQVVERKR